MSSAVAAPSSSSHTKRLSRDAEQRTIRSSPRTTVAYGPIGVQRTTSNGYRASPGSPGSPTTEDDARAAMQIQQMSATQYDKNSPQDKQSSNRPKPANPDASPSSSVPRIKTERPPSPDAASRSQNSRHRPRRLDLSNDMPSTRTAQQPGGNADRPLTSREGGTLSAIQDVGLLCLSPGFQTQNPEEQRKLARSMAVREEQRQLIESRLHEKAIGKDVEHENHKSHSNGGSPAHANANFSKPPNTSSSRRKGPPPGLSISAPSAQQFANEPRIIQSAPLNQSFTGMKPAPAHVQPLSRQVLQHTHHHNQFHGAAQSATTPQFAPLGGPQSSNQRLPPIQDVMASQEAASANPLNNPYADRERERALYAAQHPPQNQPQYAPLTATPSFTAANGHRPEPATRTPSNLSRRRTREEYEADMSAPNTNDRMDVDREGGGGDGGTATERARQRMRHMGREERERGAAAYWEEAVRGGLGAREDVGGPRDAEWAERMRRKKEEFLGLCARAWDLLHE